MNNKLKIVYSCVQTSFDMSVQYIIQPEYEMRFLGRSY
jgi:hypothetical protein